MNFLQAHATLKAFTGGPAVHVLLGMSGTGDPLELYVRAKAATQGYDARVSFLPFGTLPQALLSQRDHNVREVFLLFPWDLVPATDWRTGVAEAAPDEAGARSQADDVLGLLAQRGAALIYVDTTGAPIWLAPQLNRSLHSWLRSAVERFGGVVLDGSVFAIGSYLATGQPIALKHASVIADAVVAAALQSKTENSAKVLVTDLDHTLWHGIIGDESFGGIHFRQEGKGYRHFVYQSMLRKLRENGVLLAAVSKNEDAVVREAFASREMVLNEEDFVAIIASWEPKSAQIELLADRLNLGLDSFVFVDDNPVEIAEVSERLTQVSCIQFPSGEEGVAQLVHELVRRFQRTTVTAEDRERTGMYRRRVASLPPREGSATDIRGFLRGLEMTLSIRDRSHGDRTRAVQLINKTNQFNLNGERLADTDVEQMLDRGGRLFTASLSDRTGEHGEILAALLSSEGVVSHLVMSCRVFQRRVEFAFLAWLIDNGFAPTGFQYRTTDKNRPVQQFFDTLGQKGVQDGIVCPEWSSIRGGLLDDLSLFSLTAMVDSK